MLRGRALIYNMADYIERHKHQSQGQKGEKTKTLGKNKFIGIGEQIHVAPN